MVSLFSKLFPHPKPIIGMIHLAGASQEEKVSRALRELEIYQKEGVDGAIIENYHGGPEDVTRTLMASNREEFPLTCGVNILSNPYLSFILAESYGVPFIQLDNAQTNGLDAEKYRATRIAFPQIAVLGGVGFKYTAASRHSLEYELTFAKTRCDAVVTTGEGTGLETPLEKLQTYRTMLGVNFPLIVGAGVTLNNVRKQLSYTDGAIVGTFFKEGRDTQKPVSRTAVQQFMTRVAEIRSSR